MLESSCSFKSQQVKAGTRTLVLLLPLGQKTQEDLTDDSWVTLTQEQQEG